MYPDMSLYILCVSFRSLIVNKVRDKFTLRQCHLTATSRIFFHGSIPYAIYSYFKIYQYFMEGIILKYTIAFFSLALSTLDLFYYFFSPFSSSFD
jgi:hypothetical protein